MVYYALLSLGKALGDKNILPPMVALWLPNVVVGAMAVHFFRQAMHESPLSLPRVFENAALSVGRMTQMLRTRS
jgi:hypothetical protein